MSRTWYLRRMDSKVGDRSLVPTKQTTGFLAGVAALLKDFVPPGALQLLRRAGLYRYGFFGRYGSWQDARAASGKGYVDPAIVPTLVESTERLRQGQRPEEITPDSGALLGGLLMALRGHRPPQCTVLDFGGSLGNHYFNLRRFLPTDWRVQWWVCETDLLANVGRERFANEELRFVSSLEDAPDEFDLAIASGSLQYVEQPRHLMRRIASRSRSLLLDRLPLSRNPADRLSVQIVSPWIYRASYPAWFFSREGFLGELRSIGNIRTPTGVSMSPFGTKERL